MVKGSTELACTHSAPLFEKSPCVVSSLLQHFELESAYNPRVQNKTMKDGLNCHGHQFECLILKGWICNYLGGPTKRKHSMNNMLKSRKYNIRQQNLYVNTAAAGTIPYIRMHLQVNGEAIEKLSRRCTHQRPCHSRSICSCAGAVQSQKHSELINTNS